MADELVKQVVEQVMSALRAQGAVGPAAPRPAAPGATAPAKAAVQSRKVAETRQGQKGQEGQKVFLTADMLRRRLEASEGDGRVLELAPHEHLTPAAEDLADQRHLTIKRQTAPLALPAGAAPAGGSTCQRTLEAMRSEAAAGPAAIGLVIDRPGEAVRTVLASLRFDKLPLLDYSQTDCWIANMRLLCEAIVAGRIRAGVAILPQAAEAMVLANKTRGIRAVQGTRPDSVAEAIRQFAANLLVLEHVGSTFHEMRAMVRAFAGARPPQPAGKALLQALAHLEGAEGK